MNELVSMLVPLQGTLPGWPLAPEPSVLQVLGLLVGVPAIVFVIVAVIGKGKEFVRAARGEGDEAIDEPLWLGSAPADRSAITSGHQAEGRRAAVELSSEVGGASARW